MLGAFAALRQAIVGFVIPLRPFAWNSSAPAGRIFVKFVWVLLKSVEEILVKFGLKHSQFT
jgi:hypothetical protein